MKDGLGDRRVLRTREMLFDAFMELMIEKGYEALTVQDIVERANIGRSTFYLHFTDKEQLLTGNIEQLRDFIQEQISRRRSVSGGDCRFGFSLPMLQHAQGHRRLYKSIVGKKGGSVVMYYMKNILAELVRKDIPVLFPHPSLPIPEETVIDHIGNTFMTLLTWWMNQNTECPAAEVDEMFHKLTLSGLRGLQ